MGIILTNGHLDTNSQAITADYISTGPGTKTLSLGSSNITFNPQTAGPTIVGLSATNLTITANTATLTSLSVDTRHISAPGIDFNGTSIVLTGIGSVFGARLSLAGSTIRNLSHTTATTSTAKIRISGSFTVTGELALSNTVPSLTVESFAPGTPYTISHGPLTTNNLVTSADITLIPLGPTVTAELWEAGSLVAALGEAVVTEDEVVSFTWDAATLTALSGANVELRLSSDLDLDVGAVEWNALREEAEPPPELAESWGFIQI